MIEIVRHSEKKCEILNLLGRSFYFIEPELDDYEIEGFGDFLITAHVLWDWGRGVLMDDFLR